jgi:chaperonin GroES
VLALGKAERWNFCSHLLKLKNTSPRSIARDAEEGRAPRAGTASDAARRNLKNLFVHEENDMTFRPLHDRILVRRIEAEEKTAGGIIIPDTAKEKPQEGEVIAVGPGARDDSGQLLSLDVKVGDRILFGKWSGTEIRLNGEDLLIMKESDVMGVIDAAVQAKKAA